jgi:hypothetical protein
MNGYPTLSGTVDDDRLTFRHVPVANLRDEWPRLRLGLDVVKSTNGEPWIAEDVYAALLHQQAGLYVFEDGEELVGFGIVQVMNFPYEFQPRLNIWIGWFKHPQHGHLGIEVAQKVAKALGIASVVFATPQQNRWVEKFTRLHTWYEV